MTNNVSHCVLFISAPLLCISGGCEKFSAKGESAKTDAAPPVEVQVASPVVGQIRDYEEFTGRMEAEKTVEVRTRVSGFLWEIKFKDGAEVSANDLLFEIDPRPYKSQYTRDLGNLHLAEATLKQNQAGVEQSKANLRQTQANLRQMQAGRDQAAANLNAAQKDLERAEELKKTEGAISKQDWDKAVQTKGVAEAQVKVADAQILAAEAQVLAAEAQVKTAESLIKTAEAQIETATAAVGGSKILLDWTTVRAPIGGIISRRMLDKMSLVMADQTLLTTIVSVDNMYVYFDVDERTLLRLRNEAAIDEGTADPASEHAKPGTVVEVGLAGEDGYSLRGNVDFEDNRVDAGTGTIRLRAVVKNPKTKNGTRLLSPGLFARVRLTIGAPRMALLISDRSLGTDQGKKYLYAVVDKPEPAGGAVKHVVERRYVQTGELHGGLREIMPDTGKAVGHVGPEDRVVVAGLQRIKPGTAVKPLVVAQTPGGTTIPAKPPAAPAPAPSGAAGK